MEQVNLRSAFLQLSILPMGAELCSVRSNEGTEYLWQAKPEVWPRHAPVLFPIVGKLKENSYEYNGKRYEMNQHGFARDRVFQLLEQSETHCVFELRSSAESFSVYPFEFILRLRYTLNNRVLRTDYEVLNPGNETLLFSLGAHPGFRCPLEVGEAFEDYVLEFENETYQLRQLQDGLRAAETRPLKIPQKQLPVSAELFHNDALVFEGKQITQVSLRSTRSSRAITLRCEDWPYFGIWSKKGCREFICLEPWYGIADSSKSLQSLQNKEGIISLEPGGQFGCGFELHFE